MRRKKILQGQLTFAFRGYFGGRDFRSREQALERYFEMVASGAAVEQRLQELWKARW